MRISECKQLIQQSTQKVSFSPLEHRIFDLLQASDLSGIEIHSTLGNRIRAGKSEFVGIKGKGIPIAHQNLYKKLHELRKLNLIVEVNGKYCITDLGWCWIIRNQMMDLAKFYDNEKAVSRKPFFVELFLELIFMDDTLSQLVKDAYIRFKLEEYLFSCLREIHYVYLLIEHHKLEHDPEDYAARRVMNVAFNFVRDIVRLSINPEYEKMNLAKLLSHDISFKNAMKEENEPYQLGYSRILNGVS